MGKSVPGVRTLHSPVAAQIRSRGRAVRSASAAEASRAGDPRISARLPSTPSSSGLRILPPAAPRRGSVLRAPAHDPLADASRPAVDPNDLLLKLAAMCAKAPSGEGEGSARLSGSAEKAFRKSLLVSPAAALCLTPLSAYAYLGIPVIFDPLVDPLVDASLGPIDAEEAATEMLPAHILEVVLGSLTVAALPVFVLLTLRFTMSWYPQIERRRKEHPWSTFVTFPTDPILSPARRILDKAAGTSTVDKRDPALGGVDISPVAVAAVFCGVQQLAVTLSSYTSDPDGKLRVMEGVLEECIQLEGEMLILAWILILMRWLAFI